MSVKEVVLRMAVHAPHRLVLAPGVLEAHQRPAALGGTPGRLSTSLAALTGPEARPVAAGAVFPFVPEALNQFRGLLRGTR